MNVQWINPNGFETLHGITDRAKFESLVQAFEDAGWNEQAGPPVVMMDEYQALTGTHRIRAARKAGLELIPAVFVAELIGQEAYGEILAEVETAQDTVGRFLDELCYRFPELSVELQIQN